MTSFITKFAVTLLALIPVAGCALQADQGTEGSAEIASVESQALARRKPIPPPVSPTPTTTPVLAVCAAGVTLSPTATPPGYRVASSAGGLTLVQDPSATSTPLPVGYRVECFTTADGERFPRLVAPLAATVEVYPGGQCGVTNATGALLQCVAGSSCLAPASGAAGVCQPFPRAPISEG